MTAGINFRKIQPTIIYFLAKHLYFFSKPFILLIWSLISLWAAFHRISITAYAASKVTYILKRVTLQLLQILLHKSYKLIRQLLNHKAKGN